MKTTPALLIAIGFITASPSLAQQSNPNASPAQTAQSSQQEEVLKNGTIIVLKDLGLGESIIVEKIKSSRCDFDVSLNGLKQLKTAGVPDGVISAMLSAKSAAKGRGEAVQVADPNDPNSPHEPGIWLLEEVDGKPKMTQLEPSVYTQSKSGVGFFIQFGETVKNRAVMRSAHSEIVTTNRQPTFYFYFERTQSGLSDSHGATSPNEYVLAQFEVVEKDNQRRLVMSSLNAYSGGQHGTESRAIRSFTFQKLAPGIYKVMPKENLADGEYGFFYGGNTGGGKVFDFGVKGSFEPKAETELTDTQDQKPKKRGIKSLFQKNPITPKE